jgi:hypothetical protein
MNKQQAGQERGLPRCLREDKLIMPNISTRCRVRVSGAILAGVGLLAGYGYAADDAAWRQKRLEALNRPREVIYNNDGNEPYLWPTNRPFSMTGFLDMRTTPVLGSQVDTVFYCPVSSGFGFLTANIPTADLMLRDPSTVEHLKAYKNVLQEFLDRGTDPVREVVSWCRTNGYEVFVSLRVNDTHDEGTDQTEVGPPYAYPGNFLYSPFKIQHPEFLMGSYTNRPPYCRWSAVDFTRSEVREHFFRMCRELCETYDLDGIDLDFFRHLQFFKSVAWGGVANDAEREMMTQVMRRVRAAAEAAGKKRGRPILISVRVPDSVPYCRDVGIDLETWLREGLVDMVAGTGYWQFNPWEYMVELCRRHGAKFYASLDESRTRENADTPEQLTRKDTATYRGQAMAARRAGADGVLYFNVFSASGIRQRMWGNPERMKFHDKRYHVTYRGTSHRYASWLCKTGALYFGLKELSVHYPVLLAPGQSCEFPVWIGDDLPGLLKEGIRPVCELVINAAVPEHADLTVTVNGKAAAVGRVEKNARYYSLQPEQLLCGKNLLHFYATSPFTAKPIALHDAAVVLTEFKKR